MREFRPEEWTVDRDELIEQIRDSDFWPMSREDNARHWLEVKFHLARPRVTDGHVETVMTLAKGLRRRKRKRREEQPPSDYHAILDLPDWRPLEGGCYISLTKDFKGNKTRYTIFIDKKGYQVLDEPMFVPPETQPTPGFELIQDASFEDVFNQLVHVYREYLFLNEPEYKILACAAMSTYFREVFDTYPYIDLHAAELECGKTTTMKALIWASFHGFLPLDPTGPVLFRAIDSCKSAIGIDEVDNLLKDPDSQSRILGLLNAAYQKGLVAYRISMDEGGMPIPYDPFGLKAFTHVNAIPESIVSRSITIAMIRSPVKLPTLRNAEVFRPMRDRMYKLRLVASEEVEATYQWVLEHVELANRPKDVFAPILTMARLVGPGIFNELYDWAREYTRQHSGQQVDEVKRTLVEVLLKYTGDVKVKYIAEDLSNLCYERGLVGVDKRTGQPYRYNTRTVTRMLSSLGFYKSPKRTDGNVHVRIIAERVRRWAQVYRIGSPDVPLDELMVGKSLPKDPLIPPETSFSSLSSRQSVDTNQEATSRIEEPLKDSMTVQQENEENEDFQGTRGASDITPEPLAPDEGHVPLLLRRIARMWPDADVSVRYRPANTVENLDLMIKAFEAGYVREVEPGIWVLTPTAVEEIQRWRLM